MSLSLINRVLKFRTSSASRYEMEALLTEVMEQTDYKFNLVSLSPVAMQATVEWLKGEILG